MIVYHGSNVVVSEPRLIAQNRFLISVTASILPQTRYRPSALLKKK